ncbi:MAG: HAD family phosphatase [Patescibacteria group bacterium]
MRSIVFDLDGTIVFSHPVHFAAYEKLFKEFGINWTYDEFNDVFAGTGAPGIITAILTHNGVKNFDATELAKKKRAYFADFLTKMKLEVVPGFFDFIKEINRRGLKKIIASGSHKEDIVRMLDNIGALDEFPEIVTGYDVPMSKPAPDIFLEAARRLGVPVGECLVLEDTIHGVHAAKSAGMKCIAFLTTTPAEILKNAGADFILENYTKITPEFLDA